MADSETEIPARPKSLHGAQRAGSVSVAEAWRDSGPQILRTLTRRLGDPAAAEDVAQEALERALRSWPETPVTRPSAFLARIALNLAVNHIVAQRRRNTAHRAARDYLFAELDRPDAEQDLESRQSLAGLQVVLDGLPEQSRRVLLLNRVDGLSQSQIATQLGVSRTTVEKHMRRALARLTDLRRG